MKGFDTKALVLFPALEDYEERSNEYKSQFVYAVNRVVEYLLSNDIVPHMFITDDVARALQPSNVQWVTTLSKADTYFVKKNCDGMSDIGNMSAIEFPDLYNEITAKDPGEKDMSVEQRFEMVMRHHNKATQAIIPTYRIVVHFRFKNKMQYKVSSKLNDNKIRINVDANAFLPECLISGTVVDACDMLQIPYGNRPLTKWEVLSK